jgi:hypothetical protein
MAFHGQDMEFTAQRNGIMAGKPMKPWLTKKWKHGWHPGKLMKPGLEKSYFF